MSQSFYVLAFGRTGVRAVAPDKPNKLLGLLAAAGVILISAELSSVLMEMKNCHVRQ